MRRIVTFLLEYVITPILLWVITGVVEIALLSTIFASAPPPPTGAANMPVGFCSCTKTDTVWATFQSDVNAATAGQTICWNGSSVSGSTLSVSVSGTAGSPIRVCNSNGSTLTPTAGSNGINYSGSHLLFAGWTLIGSDSGNAFGVVNTATGLDDVAFKYNTIHDFGFSGIQENDTDCVDIEYNTLYHNASTGGSGAGGHGSNISVYEPATEAACTATWPINISNNLTYDALNPSGGYDGNGIIVDSLTNVSYTKHVLVSNNIGYGNFGGCVKDYDVATGNDLQIVNNDCYLNQQGNSPLGCRGEIANESGSGAITIGNNAIVYNSNVTGDTPIDNGCAATPVTGGNTIDNYYPSLAQTFFSSPTTDFTELSTSPTLRAGTSDSGAITVPATDIAGVSRSATFDAGAYQSTGIAGTLWQLEQTNYITSSAASQTTEFVAFNAAVTANDLIIAPFYCSGTSNTVTISDTLGSTWKVFKAANTDGVNYTIWSYWAQPAAGGADTVTVNFGTACNYPELGIEEHFITGGDSVSVDGAPVGATGSNSAPNSGIFTIHNVNEMVWGWEAQWGVSGPLTAGSGLNIAINTNNGAAGNNITVYNIGALRGNYEIQGVSLTDPWIIQAGAFMATAPSGAPPFAGGIYGSQSGAWW